MFGMKEQTHKQKPWIIWVYENAEKKIWIKLYDNKYFYGTFNSNFSLQNKQLQHIVSIRFNTLKNYIRHAA